MGIRNKQIGWSQESNLLYQVLKQTAKLTKNMSIKYPSIGITSHSGTIPNRQIGWSDESELLWEIARELNRTNSVASNGLTTTTTTLPPI